MLGSLIQMRERPIPKVVASNSRCMAHCSYTVQYACVASFSSVAQAPCEGHSSVMWLTNVTFHDTCYVAPTCMNMPFQLCLESLNSLLVRNQSAYETVYWWEIRVRMRLCVVASSSWMSNVEPLLCQLRSLLRICIIYFMHGFVCVCVFECFLYLGIERAAVVVQVEKLSVVMHVELCMYVYVGMHSCMYARCEYEPLCMWCMCVCVCSCAIQLDAAMHVVAHAWRKPSQLHALSDRYEGPIKHIHTYANMYENHTV